MSYSIADGGQWTQTSLQLLKQGNSHSPFACHCTLALESFYSVGKQPCDRSALNINVRLGNMAGAIICRSLADILSGPVALHSLRVVNFLNTASSDILVNLKLGVTGCSWQSGFGDIDLIEIKHCMKLTTISWSVLEPFHHVNCSKLVPPKSQVVLVPG